MGSMRKFWLLSLLCIAVASCTGGSPERRSELAPAGAGATKAPVAGPSSVEERTATPEPAESTTSRWVTERPAWLGTRVLPLGAEGMGIPKPTPPILRNRRFPTIDLLPPPTSRRFTASVSSVPKKVLQRSTWRPKCPVAPGDLAYLKMTFWGFDRLPHTGEMIVHESVAQDVVSVFRSIYAARFPIEEMRVTSLEEQRAWTRTPTGDTNLTSSFECRKATLGTNWSEHAYGLAMDINPFHNPYVRGDIVGPELAGAYTDRAWTRPGMIFEGDAVTRAFGAIGWGWGGRWSSLKDWMHFSRSGH